LNTAAAACRPQAKLLAVARDLEPAETAQGLTCSGKVQRRAGYAFGGNRAPCCKGRKNMYLFLASQCPSGYI